MKVFISWSGETSQQIAAILNDWLQEMIYTLEPIFTPNTLRAGTQGTAVLYTQLKEVYTGLFVYTPKAVESDWMLFEAGAIHGNAANALLIPLLFGLTYRDLPGPMRDYQWKTFTKKDMLDVLHSVALQQGKEVSRGRLESNFNRAWGELEQRVQRVLKNEVTAPPPTDELPQQIERLLQLTESIAAKQQTPPPQHQSDNGHKGVIPPMTVKDLVQQFGNLLEAVTKSSRYDLLHTLYALGKPLYFITRKMFREESSVVRDMHQHMLQLNNWLAGLSDDST